MRLWKNAVNFWSKKRQPTTTFMEDKNNSIDYVLAASSNNKFAPFVKLVWFHAFLMVENHMESEVDEIVESMSGVGRSKIRHVGGWAVRKVLNCARKYIQKSVYTKSSFTLTSVRRKQVICELLEESVIQPFKMMHNMTKYVE